nr:hypothetical protein CFP56_20973 [Quercus suber]
MQLVQMGSPGVQLLVEVAKKPRPEHATRDAGPRVGQRGPMAPFMIFPSFFYVRSHVTQHPPARSTSSLSSHVGITQSSRARPPTRLGDICAPLPAGLDRTTEPHIAPHRDRDHLIHVSAPLPTASVTAVMSSTACAMVAMMLLLATRESSLTAASSFATPRWGVGVSWPARHVDRVSSRARALSWLLLQQDFSLSIWMPLTIFVPAQNIIACRVECVVESGRK